VHSKFLVASVVTALLVSFLICSLTLDPSRISASPREARAETRVQPTAEGGREVLRVQNHSPFIVIVYVGGVRMGWLQPYRVGLIRGLLTGYQRLYAHSEYATASWGPVDLWVPGTWNIQY
jgi:hypothetical protein